MRYDSVASAIITPKQRKKLLYKKTIKSKKCTRGDHQPIKDLPEKSRNQICQNHKVFNYQEII